MAGLKPKTHTAYGGMTAARRPMLTAAFVVCSANCCPDGCPVS